MTEDADYRKQFDRFAQDDYLKMLLRTQSDSVIPMLFIDLMSCVNMIEGKAGLMLTEIERAETDSEPIESTVINNNTVKVMEGAVDMANILKALMEYYQITHKDDEV